MGAGMALGSKARMRAALAVALAAGLALSGCSNDKSGQKTVGAALAAAIKDTVGGKGGGAAPKTPDQMTRAELAAQGRPVMRVKIASRGVDRFLVLYQRSGDISVWTDGDGTTFTFRNGVLIESRGMGGELMSSAVPTPGQIAGGGSYRRTYFVNGSEDRNERRDYSCQAGSDGGQVLVLFGRSHTTRHVVETCERAEGRLTNQYWFEGGTIRKSREWLSPSVGYVEFERIID